MSARPSPRIPARNARPLPLRLLATAVCALVLGALSNPSSAAGVRARIDFSPGDLRVERSGVTAHVTLRGAETAGGEEHPALPLVEALFYVPDGFEVSGVRVTPGEETRIAEAVELGVREAAADPRAYRAFPAESVDGPGAFHPVRAGVSLSGGNLGGFRVHSVALFPVRWERATGALTFTRSLDVELELTPRLRSDEAVRQRPNPRADEVFRRALASLVANPQDLPQPSTLRDTGAGSTGFAPEELPSLEGSAVDMVIVTTAALAADFQPLADWKTRKGVPTVIRTVEWVETNYPAGVDSPERIRNFIRDAYEKWGVYLVLLGGDDGVVEPRLAWSRFYWGGREIPSDQYFACLDGDWNADGDNRWGEGTTLTEPGDEADLLPEVFVGRAAVQSPAEVATFVAKSLLYDKSPPAAYVEDHCGLGEVLFPKDWEYGVDPPGAITLDGKDLILDSLDTHVPAGWARAMRFQSDNDLNRSIALAELQTGHHLLTIMGHGDAFKFSVGNGLNPLISIADTDALTNGDRLSVVVATACNPNQFDLECQGESLMNNPNGGAIAVLGPSREDFPISASMFHANMLRMAFERGVTQFGAFNQLGRVTHVAASEVDTAADRWTMLTKMMLGDPELRIWTRQPGSLLVSHASAVTLGTPSTVVTVTDALATPLADALVCVSDGNGTYSRVRTDAAGQAVVPLSSATTGTADVVVTLEEYLPYEGTFSIDPTPAARLARTAHTFDDDGSGPSSGNGDGVLDAGETIELGITATNGGGTSADSAQVTASIEAGGSATFDFLYGGVADTARVFVGPDRVNPPTLPFTLDFATPAIDYIGQPSITLAPDTLVSGAVAGDVGIFVWQDHEGWHVRWGGGTDAVAVSGTITTDGRVRSASALAMSASSDSFAVSAGEDSLTFSSTTQTLHFESGVDFKLADSTMVTMSTSTADLGDVAAGSSSSGAVVFDISPDARVGQVACVDLTFTSTTGGPWTGSVPLVFAGPELEAYVFAVTDSGGSLSGNGNGVIEVGETVRMTPTVINRGNGEAPGVTGSATASTGITFVDGSDSYGSIASLAETGGTDGYVFTVDDSTGTMLELTLTDALGRSWAKTIDFVAPLTPDSLWFSSTPTVIDVQWAVPDSATSPDLAGYNLYRSATPGTGHVKQNHELLRSASRYVDEGLTLGSTFWYYVTSVDSSGNESAPSVEIQGWTTQVQVPGWPQRVNGFVFPGILMADADRNGPSEIYVGSHDYDFHAFASDAAPIPNFPIETSFEIWSTAAAADLDEDGNDELLFGGRDSRFYGVHHDGSPYFGPETWLVDLPGTGEGIRTAISVADIDFDSDLEIVFGTDLGTIYAFNHDGTGLADSTGLLFTCPPGDASARVWGTLPIADLDDDGQREIVVASFNDSLYVIDAAGNREPGFPRGTGGDLRGGAVAGDLDHDGTMEIVTGSFDNNIWVFNHDGSDYLPGGILATLPDQIAAGAVLANMDADPELEVFIGCFDGKLYAFNHDGSSFLPGTGGVFAALSTIHRINASPIIVDVDGDSHFEVFIGHRDYLFYGFRDDGSPVTGLPIPTGNEIFSSAAAGDLDNDGDVDVAFASYDGTINVLDFTGPSTPAAYEWPTYGLNNFRTAAYGEKVPYQVGVDVVTAVPLRLELAPNVPNPFGAATTVRYVVPRDQSVTLQVFNVAGRVVRTLVDGPVGAGSNRVVWDGRDSGGKALSSGVYFFRLDDGERTITRKGVLLR